MLEIFQGSKPSLRCPVRIKSLSARGVLLASAQPPPDLDWNTLANRDSLIHLPTGEIREIRASLLWARPTDEEVSEIEFGLELGNSNLKVRRALEDHLQAYPEDLKNLWDHWDAVHEEYDFFAPVPPAEMKDPPTPWRTPALTSPQRGKDTGEEPLRANDHTIYWVGCGAVLAGVAVYFFAPEAYRLFGVILAIYGSLTIAGKGMWSLMHRTPRSQE
ncbi:MAG: hypothetical protein ACUVXF_01570 [Desulfobaccales bacterium]